MTSSGNKCIHQLARDTGRTLSHVCRGLVDLTRYLVEYGNLYVILRRFTGYSLKKAFGKLQQGSGGAYFITTQSEIEKIRIDHAKLALRKNLDINGKDGHSCQHCDWELKEDECEAVDNLLDLEKRNNILKETGSLVYIAGYVQKGTSEIDDAIHCHENYGDFIKVLNWGDLTFHQIVELIGLFSVMYCLHSYR